MLSPPEPEDVIKEWQPHVLQQYCDDHCLDIKEIDACELIQKFSRCPIKEFQNAGTTEPLIICVLTNECEPLFKKHELSKSDFAPIQIAFEREDPFELPITPEIYGENEYCELFNEVLSQFLP